MTKAICSIGNMNRLHSVVLALYFDCTICLLWTIWPGFASMLVTIFGFNTNTQIQYTQSACTLANCWTVFVCDDLIRCWVINGTWFVLYTRAINKKNFNWFCNHSAKYNYYSVASIFSCLWKCYNFLPFSMPFEPIFWMPL